MTVLGLIRHGLTDWNKAGKMQGQTDIPLNEEGKRQARALAVYLQQERWRWDRISSSDLQRASATARIISDVLGLGDVHLDPLLRERGFGLAEGMTVAERQAKYGADLEKQAGIESEEEVLDRGRRYLEGLMLRGEGQHVLVVSHGAYLKRLFSLLIPELPDVYIDNASLTVVEKTSEGWSIQLHNYRAHAQT